MSHLRLGAQDFEVQTSLEAETWIRLKEWARPSRPLDGTQDGRDDRLADTSSVTYTGREGVRDERRRARREGSRVAPEGPLTRHETAARLASDRKGA